MYLVGATTEEYIDDTTEEHLVGTTEEHLDDTIEEHLVDPLDVQHDCSPSPVESVLNTSRRLTLMNGFTSRVSSRKMHRGWFRRSLDRLLFEGDDEIEEKLDFRGYANRG